MNPDSLNFGEYQILQRLRTGGMGDVYLAQKCSEFGFTKYFVIKTLLPKYADNENAVKQFIDEARIMSSLTQSNIVTIIDFVQDPNNKNFYYVMEYIDGYELREILYKLNEQDLILPTDLATYITLEVCKAISYAHDAKNEKNTPLNIVHSDISPSNILISKAGDIKLIDFGIARAENTLQKATPGKIQGKVPYMSPEQASGSSDLDKRSDIFSLGLVYYEMLTGEKLFKSSPTNELEMLKLVQQCNVVPKPSDLIKKKYKGDLDNIPFSNIEEILQKALAKNRDDRYQTAKEFSDQLETNVLRFFKGGYSGRLKEQLFSLFPESTKSNTIDGTFNLHVEENALNPFGEPVVSLDFDQADSPSIAKLRNPSSVTSSASARSSASQQAAKNQGNQTVTIDSEVIRQENARSREVEAQRRKASKEAPLAIVPYQSKALEPIVNDHIDVTEATDIVVAIDTPTHSAKMISGEPPRLAITHTRLAIEAPSNTDNVVPPPPEAPNQVSSDIYPAKKLLYTIRIIIGLCVIFLLFYSIYHFVYLNQQQKQASILIEGSPFTQATLDTLHGTDTIKNRKEANPIQNKAKMFNLSVIPSDASITVNDIPVKDGYFYVQPNAQALLLVSAENCDTYKQTIDYNNPTAKISIHLNCHQPTRNANIDDDSESASSTSSPKKREEPSMLKQAIHTPPKPTPPKEGCIKARAVWPNVAEIYIDHKLVSQGRSFYTNSYPVGVHTVEFRNQKLNKSVTYTLKVTEGNDCAVAAWDMRDDY